MAEPLTRRLVAIMFADMVGFTSLMQEDEETARTLRDRYRAILSESVERHNGEIRQYYGDGALSIFRSAVKAVQCAVEVQQELLREPRVPVRIGVHEGDIVQDADGVYGDGVNLASRIEGLSAAGGVMISGKVFDEVKNHASIETVSLGEVRLKNVASPVRVFAITNEGLAVPTEEEVRSRSQHATEGASESGAAGASARVHGGAGEVFLSAVRQRSIVPWSIAYLAAAFIVLLVLRFTTEQLGWSPSVIRGADVLAFVGFLVTLVVAWYHGEPGRQRVRFREVVIVTGLLGAGLGTVAVIGPGASDSEDDGSRRVVAAQALKPGIAVLPFDNLSPDQDDAYFAYGIQEDITTALSHIRALRVTGRASVDQYRENRPASRDIARTLGVDYLIEGTAQILGGQVVVTVGLIDAVAQERIWSERYERDFSLEEIIAVQNEVAQAVAENLETIITPDEAALIAALPTTDPEAMRLYKVARHAWNRRTEQDVRQALTLLHEAIELDPGFALAHAALADAYLVLSNWGWMPHSEAYPLAVEAAEQALTLDPLIPSVHASLGALSLWFSRDWEASEEHFKAAIELDPEYHYGHSWYSALLAALDRNDEAILEATLGWQLDPLAPQTVYLLARAHFIARDYHQAVRQAVEGLSLHPEYRNLHSILCNAYLAAGSMVEAEDACQALQQMSGGAYTLNIGILEAFRGNGAAARAAVEDVVGSRDRVSQQPVIVAMVYAVLGDLDEAMDWLDIAVDQGYPHLEYLTGHPFYDNLRSDPRFSALLNRLNLPGIELGS